MRLQRRESSWRTPAQLTNAFLQYNATQLRPIDSGPLLSFFLRRRAADMRITGSEVSRTHIRTEATYKLGSSPATGSTERRPALKTFIISEIVYKMLYIENIET